MTVLDFDSVLMNKLRKSISFQKLTSFTDFMFFKHGEDDEKDYLDRKIKAVELKYSSKIIGVLLIEDGGIYLYRKGVVLTLLINNINKQPVVFSGEVIIIDGEINNTSIKVDMIYTCEIESRINDSIPNFELGINGGELEIPNTKTEYNIFYAYKTIDSDVIKQMGGSSKKYILIPSLETVDTLNIIPQMESKVDTNNIFTLTNPGKFKINDFTLSFINFDIFIDVISLNNNHTVEDCLSALLRDSSFIPFYKNKTIPLSYKNLCLDRGYSDIFIVNSTLDFTYKIIKTYYFVNIKYIDTIKF